MKGLGTLDPNVQSLFLLFCSIFDHQIDLTVFSNQQYFGKLGIKLDSACTHAIVEGEAFLGLLRIQR